MSFPGAPPQPSGLDVAMRERSAEPTSPVQERRGASRKGATWRKKGGTDGAKRALTQCLLETPSGQWISLLWTFWAAVEGCVDTAREVYTVLLVMETCGHPLGRLRKVHHLISSHLFPSSLFLSFFVSSSAQGHCGSPPTKDP